MPPKTKLHRNKGKLSSLPKSTIESSSISEDLTQNSMNLDQQFELELCWCIQQLQTALSFGKLNPKQVQETTKTLNVLMSNSSSVIRKRQLMRLSFGDYRKKMAEEEKKMSKTNNQMKLIAMKPSNKSMFMKKSVLLSSNSNFKFNFNVSTEDQTANEISKIKLQNEDQESNNSFHYKPSDNTFRFNFNQGEN